MEHFFYASLVVFSILSTWTKNSSGLQCEDDSLNRLKFKFYLIKSFHRSLMDKLHAENVDSLESCVEMARSYKGLALNYSPKERYFQKDIISGKISRDHYWQQPQLYFNCHILQCPENFTSKTLINDTSFDYYSLYDGPIVIPNYICMPQVGLFTFHTIGETFQNASQYCRYFDSHHHCGNLAHIASGRRTTSLSQAMTEYNEQQEHLKVKPMLHLAYVGLYFNRTRAQRFQMFNMDGENLECFRYRAWEPGNPKISFQLINTSCTALTSHGTWLTVDCKRKLPYFCEILTRCEEESDESLIN